MTTATAAASATEDAITSVHPCHYSTPELVREFSKLRGILCWQDGITRDEQHVLHARLDAVVGELRSRSVLD